MAANDQPKPDRTDPRHYDWPRPEVRHLIAGLPDTSLGHWRRRGAS